MRWKFQAFRWMLLLGSLASAALTLGAGGRWH